MATLGQTGGGSVAYGVSPNEIAAFLIGQMPGNGTLQSVTLDIGTSGSGTMYMAVYTGTATAPVTRIADAGSVAVPGTHANTTLSGLSGALTSGDYIWIATNLAGGASGCSVYLTATPGGRAAYDYSQTPGTWDNPFLNPVDDSFSQDQSGGYITYSTGGGGGTVTKSADDSLTPSDQAPRSIKRGRVNSETAVLSDGTVQWFRRVRNATETLILADGAVQYFLRKRDGSDILTIDDETGGIYEIRITADDTVVVTDGYTAFMRRLRQMSEVVAITDLLDYWRRMQRVATDSAVVVDGFIKSLLRAGGINVVIASDTVELSDSAVEIFRKVRTMFDVLEVDDGIVRVLWSTKYLSDALGVSEQAIATLVPYVTYQYAPRIILGISDYCRVQLGGYS